MRVSLNPYEGYCMLYTVQQLYLPQLRVHTVISISYFEPLLALEGAEPKYNIAGRRVRVFLEARNREPREKAEGEEGRVGQPHHGHHHQRRPPHQMRHHPAHSRRTPAGKDPMRF